MDRADVRTVFLTRDVLVAFMAILGLYFVPPLLTGGQLLYDSWAAPVWTLAIDTGATVGCGSLSCVPLIAVVFLTYTYLLAVVLAAVSRGGRNLAR